MIKAIETEYKGYRFRSRLEARWAVFFDACGANWEYEPEGFDLGDGTRYLPDFLIHGVDGRVNGDLWVEVKGVMTRADAEKILKFCGVYNGGRVKNPILVVGRIPEGETMREILDYHMDVGYHGFSGYRHEPYPFNFETIDNDYFVAHPGINKNGHFELFGNDANYLCDQNDYATLEAYRAARQARFEHGERPR